MQATCSTRRHTRTSSARGSFNWLCVIVRRRIIKSTGLNCHCFFLWFLRLKQWILRSGSARCAFSITRVRARRPEQWGACRPAWTGWPHTQWTCLHVMASVDADMKMSQHRINHWKTTRRLYIHEKGEGTAHAHTRFAHKWKYHSSDYDRKFRRQRWGSTNPWERESGTRLPVSTLWDSPAVADPRTPPE